MLPIKTILYPTDFSSFSTPAYFHAVALAESNGSTLAVLNVFTPEGEPGDEPNRRESRAKLTQIRPANPAIPVRHVFLEGDPATEITRYATENNVDLIVMGTHGRGGIDRLLLGSVAESVMREAPCSVMVIKMPRAART